VGPRQTTALVDEAYLKLRGSRGWSTDAHFFRAAALATRHALVNHAVARLASKRGAGVTPLSIDAALEVAAEIDDTTIALNEAMGRLARDSLRLAQIVECRYFAGYNDAETALVSGISERTVLGDWTLARAWLHREPVVFLSKMQHMAAVATWRRSPFETAGVATH